ncbi:MAG: ECF transporter S component [Clostridia bacterium]|nr:ECF transporter S component [Clostridia bacterium]
MEKSKMFNARKLTMTAMFGAISFILMFFKLNIPFFSPVADFDLSAFPELLGGFMLGPICALVIIVIKLALKLAILGTSTMFTGELQNLLLSIAYVLPAVLYYRKNRTKKGAVIGVVIGSVASIIIAVFTNIYLIFPFYMEVFGMDWEKIIGMFSAANSYIKDVPTLIAFSIVPFNLISRTVTSLLTILLYKKISVPMKKWMA